MKDYPLIAPQPPRLSEQIAGLRRIEASGIFSNSGPEVRQFELDVTDQLFGGHGASLAISNATLGLMIAIRHAAGLTPTPGRMALMPSLTFAATAHAAQWAGLTPLIADIDSNDWGLCAATEERLLKDLGGRIAVIVPYATFGNAIDLDRYRWLQRCYGVGVVIDAAASLGTIDDDGRGFGTDAPFPVVFSMHATKTFAVAEGGLIHCGDAALINSFRAMANFGFDGARSATLPGINAKMPELIGLLARTKLTEIEHICHRRAEVEIAYRQALSDFDMQAVRGRRRASQFMPVLLPPDLAGRRDAVIAVLAEKKVGAGQYFSPHLAEQPWFRKTARIEATPRADQVAGALISLPITDTMTPVDAAAIAERFIAACDAVRRSRPARKARSVRAAASVMIVGGGPAGTALLTAASKRGALADLARSGLVIVERSGVIGGGRLGGYAITSDSTAHTFLSAIRDNPHPALAELAEHPVAQAVDRYADALGVPLVDVGALLRTTGDRLAEIVRANGGTILTGHEARSARQLADGRWQVRLRQTDGSETERLSDALVIATGGHQPIDRLAAQMVAGAPLIDLAAGRLVQSDEVLALGGMAKIADLLTHCPAPKIAVVGGSTSALATIILLLKANPALALGAGAVTLLHRRPLRPFYPTAEAAKADGFSDFTADDICPVSGFVYRLAGFRLEARELVLRMLGIGGRVPDPRVHCHRITGDDDGVARAHLERADLVIAALGYRPHALPLHDIRGRPMALAAHRDAPMVDRYCRVLGADGTPISNLFGIGLAAGFVPWGKLGGEASFKGQANGLWLWQNDVGQLIVDQILAHSRRAVA